MPAVGVSAKSLAYLTTPTEGSTRLKQMQVEIDNPVYRKNHHQPTLFRGMIDASGGMSAGRAEAEKNGQMFGHLAYTDTENSFYNEA